METLKCSHFHLQLAQARAKQQPVLSKNILKRNYVDSKSLASLSGKGVVKDEASLTQALENACRNNTVYHSSSASS